jgi:hypothetical protein
MNKRIEELMLEAGYAAPHLAGRAHKLVDLIVQECAAVYRDNVNMKCPMFPTEFSAALRKHFGVKDE